MYNYIIGMFLIFKNCILTDLYSKYPQNAVFPMKYTDNFVLFW